MIKFITPKNIKLKEKVLIKPSFLPSMFNPSSDKPFSICDVYKKDIKYIRYKYTDNKLLSFSAILTFTVNIHRLTENYPSYSLLDLRDQLKEIKLTSKLKNPEPFIQYLNKNPYYIHYRDLIEHTGRGVCEDNIYRLSEKLEGHRKAYNELIINFISAYYELYNKYQMIPEIQLATDFIQSYKIEK